jgi:hypothetical protein
MTYVITNPTGTDTDLFNRTAHDRTRGNTLHRRDVFNAERQETANPTIASPSSRRGKAEGEISDVKATETLSAAPWQTDKNICANNAMLYHHGFAGETGMSLGVVGGIVKAET